MIKRILFFFPENPFSNRAGNVTRAKTTLSVLKTLGYQIDLVGVKDIYKEQNDTIEFDKNIVDNLFLISRRPPKKKTSVEYWKHKFLKKTNKYNPALTDYTQHEFEKIFNLKKYDSVIINYEFWAGLIDNLAVTDSLKIIDTHDWITLNEFFKNPAMKIGDRFEAEINNLNKFDRVITISNDENFVFKGFLGNKVVNISPTFPSNFSSDPEKKYDLIFVGSENFFNIKSIQWFFDKVYPLLPEQINILIIGRICKHIEPRKGVELVEFAENLNDYYHKSKISICPMLEGTGIKIKVVEALSFGLPVVGTKRSVDGFSSKNNNGCIITNDPKEFRDSIVSLLENESYYNQIKKEAEIYFESNFSEKLAIEKWKNILKHE